MKRLVVGFLGVVLGLTFFAVRLEAAQNFAYVDLSRIFSEYSKTKDYDKALSEKQSAYEAERDKRVNEIKQLQDKMNLLSDKEKEAKNPEFETKVKTLQEFDRQKQTDLRKEQDEKTKEILKDIEKSVQGYAEKEGYALVFNDRVLVYQSKSMDITDKVIDMLNNKGAKK